MASIGHNIRQLRKRQKMTLEDVAARVGTDTGKQGVTESMLYKLAECLNVKPAELVASETATFPVTPERRSPRDVPVAGTVEGDPDGYLEDSMRPVPAGVVRCPAKDGQTYALGVRGESMRPRIKSGEFIIAEPNRRPSPGDDVVVVLYDGRKMIKELLYQHGDDVTLGSITNRFKPITLHLGDIEAIHYVAAIIPRAAFYTPKKGELPDDTTEEPEPKRLIDRRRNNLGRPEGDRRVH